MKKQELNQLKEALIKIVLESVKIVYEDDPKFIIVVEEGTLQLFKKAPGYPPVVDTMKGIIGFHNYLSEKNPEFDHSTFVTNALHDLNECILNWSESWYSPRTKRYIEYYNLDCNEKEK